MRYSIQFNKKMCAMRSLIVLAFFIMSLGLTAQNREVRTYYDNGTLKSTYRYTSASNYEVTNYYPSGKIMESGRFINGKMDGAWTSYAVNGIRTSEGLYKNGEKIGEWKLYDDNGSLRQKLVYEANRVINSTPYHRPANAVAESHIH